MGFPEADYVVDELKLALNTDSQIPINHIIWLNDYKFYGEESYVYQDKNKLHELYKDGALCIMTKVFWTRHPIGVSITDMLVLF